MSSLGWSFSESKAEIKNHTSVGILVLTEGVILSSRDKWKGTRNIYET
jgi:hypothetical protein